MANETIAQQPDKAASTPTWLIGAGVVAIIALLGVIITILLGMQKATPEEIAERYVNDNIDLLGGQIAGFLLESDSLLKEIGGEYVEEQIHRVKVWNYSQAEPLGNGRYEVIATSLADFNIDSPMASGEVAAKLPFIIVVDHYTQRVISSEPHLSGAAFSSDLLPAPYMSLDDAMNMANEAMDKARKLRN